MIKKALYKIFYIVLSVSIGGKTSGMAQEQKDKCTQNEAYLKHVTKEQIKHALGIDPDKYQHFFDQSNQVEVNFPTHYGFFHGQDGMYLILHELQKRLVHLFENTSATDFVYLRARNELVKSRKQLEVLLQGGLDNSTPMRKILLSVNLSIPGVFVSANGSVVQDETTLGYLASDCSHLRNSYPSIIRTYLAQFDERFKHETFFTTIIIAKIIAVMQSLASTQSPEKRQLLLQIFIPKNKVDQNTYLSLPYGLLYTEPIYDTNLPKIWDSEKKAYLHPRIDAWDNNKKRYTVSRILHVYRNEPEKLAAVLNRIQVRIVLTEDLFAHPENGVKVFAHHLFDPTVLKHHLQHISLIAQEIFNTRSQETPESKLSELVSLTLALPCSPHAFILDTIKNALLKNLVTDSDALSIIKKTFGAGYPEKISSSTFFPDELHIVTDILKILATKKEQQEAIGTIVRRFLSSDDSLVQKWGLWFEKKLKEQEENLPKI